MTRIRALRQEPRGTARARVEELEAENGDFRRVKSSQLLFGGQAVYQERLLDRPGI